MTAAKPTFTPPQRIRFKNDDQECVLHRVVAQRDKKGKIVSHFYEYQFTKSNNNLGSFYPLKQIDIENMQRRGYAEFLPLEEK